MKKPNPQTSAAHLVLNVLGKHHISQNVFDIDS